ncbi:MAG: helix-turn-helix domain-containing protein [Spirochaetales bacterium]|nr:helix-turn-helix domain-containing protein [Spirochaetales bacterium]MDD7270591.1 helix-turn-helix domain-containing protein [Spirochaetales bacterium]
METLSLVIVEDEKLILEELVTTVDWASIGVSVVATAEDGVMGEKIIKEYNPDIVITDIRLPLQDGLTMVSKCPLLDQNVLVLSGYTDFEYTRKAIQLGVYDYLEKPVDDEELLKVCSTLADKIREEHKSEKQEDGAFRINLPTGFHNHQISCIVAYIKENYEKPIGLADAAEYIRLSENHLSTLFKEVTGINFLQYLNGYRLNMAIDMMKEGGVNISEIAPKCGFQNPGYFAKIFKRYFGMTPTQFRDQL